MLNNYISYSRAVILANKYGIMYENQIFHELIADLSNK